MNEPWVFSVASHFMLFSGVTWPKLSMMSWALEPRVRSPWSVATPIYFFPRALKAASMEHLAPFFPLPPTLGEEEDVGFELGAVDDAITVCSVVGSASGLPSRH